MPRFVTLRLQKIKSTGSLRFVFEHNTRDRPPLHADPARAHLNKVDHTTEESLTRYRELLPAKVRKNAVLAVEFVVQGPANSPGEVTEAYFNAAAPWLAARLGGEDNRLSTAIHYDEESPHLHVVMMPLRDGKLNYDSYLGGKKFALRQLQTDFAREVGARFGFERGIERSGIEHRNHNAYRQQMATPLTGLPIVTLPEPKPGQSARAYGEEVARLYNEAYGPLLERLTAVTNKVKIHEADKDQLKVVSSARAKENDKLRADFAAVQKLIIENGRRLEDYRAALMLAVEKTKAKTKKRGRDDGYGR